MTTTTTTEEHVSMTTTSDITATPEAAKAPDKPLNTTQVRALQKLIKNDYEQLTVDLSRAAQARELEAEAQVRRQWRTDHPTSSAEFLAEQANAAIRRFNTTMTRLQAEANVAGVTFGYSLPSTQRADVRATDRALNEAIETAKEEVRRLHRDARSRMNRKRLETERKILLAGVTPAVQVLLDALPTGAQALELEARGE